MSRWSFAASASSANDVCSCIISACIGPAWLSPSSQSIDTWWRFAIAARVSARGSRRLVRNSSCDSVERSMRADAANSDWFMPLVRTTSASRS